MPEAKYVSDFSISKNKHAGNCYMNYIRARLYTTILYTMCVIINYNTL